MNSVSETSVLSRRADALLTRDERIEVIGILASRPEAGDIIQGTGGVRKLRFGAGGRGKRGAFRVVYYVSNANLPVVAITLYGKNEKADLTPSEKLGAKAIVAWMKKVLARK